MAQNVAAGLLMCRLTPELEFFLVHPGGPFFKNRDLGAWSIPKGLPDPADADLLSTAVREFGEETGLNAIPPLTSLGSIRQKSGKSVFAWTFLGDWDPATGIKSNTFRMEWPPRSGKFQEFPEQDRAAWWNYADARAHIIAEQSPFLDAARAVFQ